MASTIRRYCLVFCWGVALFLLLLGSAVFADTVHLELKRVIIIEDGDFTDSYVDEIRPHGTLVIETDEFNVIRRMEYSVWMFGEAWIDERAVVVDYSSNGALYILYSQITQEHYEIKFLRRAPLNDSYDPATIFMLTLDDGRVLIVDYRYKRE